MIVKFRHIKKTKKKEGERMKNETEIYEGENTYIRVPAIPAVVRFAISSVITKLLYELIPMSIISDAASLFAKDYDSKILASGAITILFVFAVTLLGTYLLGKIKKWKKVL